MEGYITAQSLIHDANNQDIADFRQKGLPAGTNVLYRAEQRGDRLVLTGLKVPGQAGGQQKVGGKKEGKAAQTGDVPPPRDSIGAKPLTELGKDTYKGESGGLYGNGSNDPRRAARGGEEGRRANSAARRPWQAVAEW